MIAALREKPCKERLPLTSRKPKMCSLAQVKFRNYSPCNEPADYRVHATLDSGREFLIYLCQSHMSHAWALAEALMERHVDGDPDARLECISYHQLKRKPRLVRRKSLLNPAA